MTTYEFGGPIANGIFAGYDGQAVEMPLDITGKLLD
jgi:hypothetical protein